MSSSSPSRFRIPFRELGPEIAETRAVTEEAIRRVLDSGHLLLGPELEAFEHAFSAWNGGGETVGLASGLAALELMLRAFNIGPGDEVIVPANTYIATWLAVSSVGATPVPVEPVRETRNIDPKRLEAALTPRTKAVLAVHLYGAPCDMAGLRGFCENHGLPLLIDAAQSTGAAWRGDRSACLGDAAAFSFYPTKNLGALGDAGALWTRHPQIAADARLRRNYGMASRYQHEIRGVNARMEELHAAVLAAKLPHVDRWNARRAELAARMRERLGGEDLIGLMQVPAEADAVWHLFTVTVPRRDEIAAGLAARGIGTAVHYPVPPHLSGAYRDQASAFPALPVTEALAGSLLSLPLHPWLSDDEADTVTEALIHAVRTI